MSFAVSIPLPVVVGIGAAICFTGNFRDHVVAYVILALPVIVMPVAVSLVRGIMLFHPQLCGLNDLLFRPRSAMRQHDSDPAAADGRNLATDTGGDVDHPGRYRTRPRQC